jgi:threonine dehydrogenase-like Zn-dependent dehydrogenase
MLIPIPDDLSFEHGALVEPLAVALHGIDIGEASGGDRCVVIGAGPIGVMTALALKARGIEDVIVIERNEHRAGRMRSLGVEAIGLDDVHNKVIEAFGPPLLSSQSSSCARAGSSCCWECSRSPSRSRSSC